MPGIFLLLDKIPSFPILQVTNMFFPMIITPLGHTEFLVDITGVNERNVRIMVDGWFSNYAL